MAGGPRLAANLHGPDGASGTFVVSCAESLADTVSRRPARALDHAAGQALPLPARNARAQLGARAPRHGRLGVLGSHRARAHAGDHPVQPVPVGDGSHADTAEPGGRHLQRPANRRSRRRESDAPRPPGAEGSASADSAGVGGRLAAGRAHAGDLDPVRVDAEAVLGGELVEPGLQVAVAELDDAVAARADEVVVVARRRTGGSRPRRSVVQSVSTTPLLASAGQRAVDGREADAHAVVGQQAVVDLLRGRVVRLARERAEHGDPLPRRAQAVLCEQARVVQLAVCRPRRLRYLR